MNDKKKSAGFWIRLFGPFALGYFVSYLFRTVNAVIAQDLTRDLQLNAGALGLLTATYFLTFAACQLPLGVLLDHFGPRRVESVLLIVAACGALVFAKAESIHGLIFGRALIGIGVSACLMAAFKAFSCWLPAARLPFANGVQMVSGGLGALAATTPVQKALTVTDWRGVFTILAGVTLLAALVVFFCVPEPPRPQQPESLPAQLRGVQSVLTSRAFWTITPWAFCAQAAYLSIQGLWAGPWLRDVAGYSADSVAHMLFWIAVAMICGYFSIGSLTERLSRWGIPPVRIVTGGMLVFIGVQVLLVIAPGYAPFLWFAFGFFGTTNILVYALLAREFPKQLTGRVNTTLNLLVFIAAFCGQWLIGAVVDLWPVSATGHYAETGYQVAMLILVGCQLLAGGWYWLAKRGK